VASVDAELRAKIKLILGQVMRNAFIYTLPGTDTRASLGSQMPSGEVPVAAPGAVEMRNEQVVLLMRLYSGCRPKSQRLFPSLLLSEITLQVVPVIVQVILQTGHLQHLEKLLADAKRLSLQIRAHMWEAIREALQMEAHRFSEEDLTRLEAMQAAEVKRTPVRRPRKHPLERDST